MKVTRWALSFLRGPLSRDQIATLMAGRKAALSNSQEAPRMPAATKGEGGERPVLEPGITELFAAPPETVETGPSAVETALAQLDPDALSPREALDALYQLKKQLEKK